MSNFGDKPTNPLGAPMEIPLAVKLNTDTVDYDVNELGKDEPKNLTNTGIARDGGITQTCFGRNYNNLGYATYRTSNGNQIKINKEFLKINDIIYASGDYSQTFKTREINSVNILDAVPADGIYIYALYFDYNGMLSLGKFKTTDDGTNEFVSNIYGTTIDPGGNTKFERHYCIERTSNAIGWTTPPKYLYNYNTTNNYVEIYNMQTSALIKQ